VFGGVRAKVCEWFLFIQKKRNLPGKMGVSGENLCIQNGGVKVSPFSVKKEDGAYKLWGTVTTKPTK